VAGAPAASRAPGAPLPPAGATRATPSRYAIPFASMAPTAQLFVSASGDDAAAGSEAAPKRTLQAAFDAATPGTALMIAAGTYSENLKLTHSGASGAPIWLVSKDGPGLAKITPAKLDDSTVQGYGVHDLVLEGLDVTAPAPTQGDSDAIKFAASGDVSVPANQNADLAIVDCTVHTAAEGGYNGIKISTTDRVYVIHDWFEGAGAMTSGDALDFVGNTNSEIAYSYATGVPAHSAFQIKGGSTTVSFHDNLITQVGADGLWIGGGTVEEYMHPSSAYEACDVRANNNLMHDLGGSAIHFVGGQSSVVTHLFAYGAGNHYVQAIASPDHSPQIRSANDRVADSQFDPSQDVLFQDSSDPSAVAADPANDLPFTAVSDSSGHHSFDGGTRITAGGGHDVFKLSAGHGTTVIAGFQTASDVVHLAGYTLSSTAALDGLTHQVGPSVFVDLPDGTLLVLEGIDAGALSGANFAID
jgi:hypothetical protein